MAEAVSFFLELVTAPSKALKRLGRHDAGLTEAARIYAAFLAVTIAFYAWKPADFPPPSEEMAHLQGWGEELPTGLVFWTKVNLWEPVLRAVWIVYMGWFASLLAREGRLKWRLLVAAAAAMAPAIPIALFKVLPRPVFGLCWILLCAAMAPGLKRRDPASWKRLASLALAVTALNLALAPAFAGTVAFGWPAGYNALEIVLLFWTVGLGAYLLSRLERLSTPRAFAAVFLSLLSQMIFVAAMFLLGLLPKDVLKALMTV